MKLGLLTAACAALLAVATPAVAMRVAAPAPAIRAAMAHTIIVGKVESIEEKTVSAKPFPGAPEKVEYQIAVIKISDPILAAKGLTHIRVGFIPPPPPPVRNPGGPVIIRSGGNNSVTFTKDQEVLVFLRPHDDGNFMIVGQYYDAINKQGNQQFENMVTETKTFVKMLENPKESLKAEKQADRFTAAAMLITKYRTRRLGATEPKTEAVDAEMSKLVLTALAEADWKGQGGPALFRLNPLQVFLQLNLTDKDGYEPPMMEVMGRKQIDYANLPDYAKQWCKDNADKYKIQRYVYEEKKKEKSDK